MITPNDTLLTREVKKNTPLICPTINANDKKDITHHPNQNIKLQRLTPAELYKIDRRSFAKSYLMIDCPVCGHSHPVSRFLYKKIEAEIKRKWSRDLNNRLTPEQRKTRAIKAGIARALKAGQTLKPSTIQKCTGRKIYREVASSLQI